MRFAGRSRGGALEPSRPSPSSFPGTASHSKALIFLLPLMLSGCALFNVGTAPRQQAESIVQGGGPERPRPDSSPVPPSSTGVTGKADLDAAVSKIEEKITSSNNANQNTITGLGANVNKLAEHLDASLLRMETSIPISIKNDLRNEMSLNANATASAVAEFRNTITAQNKMIAELQLKVGDLTASLEASAKAQVALSAKMEDTKNELKAGRDAINVRNQLDDNTMKILKESYSTQYWTTVAFCGVVVKIVMILGYRSRSRSETRYADEREERKKLTDKLLKSLDRNRDGKIDAQDFNGGGKPNATA